MTKDKAWDGQQTVGLLIAIDDVCEGVPDPRHRNMRLVRLGFNRGYDAAIAAERSRIVAELRAEAAKCEWEVEAGGFMTAIEIVKGGDGR